jgi:hypothetical protein
VICNHLTLFLIGITIHIDEFPPSLSDAQLRAQLDAASLEAAGLESDDLADPSRGSGSGHEADVAAIRQDLMQEAANLAAADAALNELAANQALDEIAAEMAINEIGKATVNREQFLGWVWLIRK